MHQGCSYKLPVYKKDKSDHFSEIPKWRWWNVERKKNIILTAEEFAKPGWMIIKYLAVYTN